MTDRAYDVIVVGAGPGGLAAAWEAASQGAQVALLESSPWLGGQIWKDSPEHPVTGQGRRWIERVQSAGIEVFKETTVVAVPTARSLLTESSGGGRVFRWQKLILATGARELFVPFPGWTLPQVVGVGGLQALVKSAWPVKDRRMVIVGSGPLLLAVAAEMRKQGAEVLGLYEQTPWRGLLGFGQAVLSHPSKLVQGAGLGRYLVGIPYRCGWWPVRAEGQQYVESVTLTNGKETRDIDCDLLACAYGLIPNDELPRLLKVGCHGARVLVNENQRSSVDNIFAVGELTGIAGVDGALVEGRIAGLCATGQADKARALFRQRRGWQRFQRQLANAFQLRPELRTLVTDDTIICRCEDVTYGELKQQHNLQDAKLLCRCGMGNCQGRVCGSALQFLREWETTSVREPLRPVRLETLRAPLLEETAG